MECIANPYLGNFTMPNANLVNENMNHSRKNIWIFVLLMICYGSSVVIMVDVIPISGGLRALALFTFIFGVIGLIVVVRKKVI